MLTMENPLLVSLSSQVPASVVVVVPPPLLETSRASISNSVPRTPQSSATIGIQFFLPEVDSTIFVHEESKDLVPLPSC